MGEQSLHWISFGGPLALKRHSGHWVKAQAADPVDCKSQLWENSHCTGQALAGHSCLKDMFQMETVAYGMALGLGFRWFPADPRIGPSQKRKRWFCKTRLATRWPCSFWKAQKGRTEPFCLLIRWSSMRKSPCRPSSFFAKDCNRVTPSLK